MEEIIQNVKTSSMLKETEHLIKEMIENIGKITHISQKDGEVDMMLISCNILLILK
jgi:hypothetical protein